MAHQHKPTRTCGVCGRTYPSSEVISGHAVREAMTEEIRRDHPDWTGDGFICRQDLLRIRARYVHRLLESDKGELSALEREVEESLREHEILTRDVESTFEASRRPSERMADQLATFGGSWRFLILFGVVLVVWIVTNGVLLARSPDPYPFILLNLVLSCLAAVQAPVIMMSQNRQEARDRLRAQHDYQINLKAELEIRQLHEKIDHLLSHQWERLVEIQEIQLDLLGELADR